VILAEVAAMEMVAGGGVTGMLVLVTTAMLRRSKDTDERKDEFSKIVLDAAAEREAKAERREAAAVAEVERLRQQLDQERLAWQEERSRLLRGPS
jgi:hypothetical protein